MACGQQHCGGFISHHRIQCREDPRNPGTVKETKSEVQIRELFDEFEFETPSPHHPDSPVCASPAPSDKQADRLQKKKPKKQPTPSPELVKAQVRLSQLQGQVHNKSRELDELRQANQELTYAIKVKEDKLSNKRPTYSALGLKGFQRQRQELTAERDLALARLQEAVQRACLAEQLAADAVRDREEAIGEREKLTEERDYATKLYESLRRSVDVEDSDFPLSIRKTVDRQVQTYLSLVHRQGGAFNMMFQGGGADGIAEGKTKNHLAGSLELMVENFVKRWETESAHFKELDQWSTINKEKYHVKANGGKIFNAEESDAVGSYNWLMWDCKKELYDAEKQDFQSSLRQFRGAFPKGFPWEVLEVSSGPPTVAFTWRHWAHFTGQYMGRQGSGQLIEMHGSAVVELDKNNKIVSIQIDYKPEEFLKALLGDTSDLPCQLSTEKESACPMCPKFKSVL
uniref:Uncharacterized protein n=1 Tax=Branchiostoma floridae TaxID=7739 RepID=C3ZBJ6_BRAFL|eukprot:XP_002594222.1 hypothetical protein BRAFLDRAFT_65070 [Branchiostoma floridae]